MPSGMMGLPLDVGGLFGDKYDLGDYEDVFSDYDPTKEKFLRSGYERGQGIAGRQTRAGMFQVNTEFSSLSAKSGFAQFGKLDAGRRRTKTGVLGEFRDRQAGARSDFREGAFGLQENWRQKQWDRLVDLIRSEAVTKKKGGGGSHLTEEEEQGRDDYYDQLDRDRY